LELRGIAPVAKLTIIVTLTSDVKSSRPKFWPRPQSFSLGLEVLGWAWPWSCCRIM